VNAERERELLGLIVAYMGLVGASPGVFISEGKNPAVVADFRRPRRVPTGAQLCSERYENSSIIERFTLPAAWAESEACLREVAGECAVRCVEVSYSPEGSRVNLRYVEPVVVSEMSDVIERTAQGNDPSRPVALLKAFDAAFGGTGASKYLRPDSEGAR